MTGESDKNITSSLSIKPDTLFNATTVVELRSTTHDETIRELVGVVDWAEYGVSNDELIEAIEEREATAQTVVAEDLAIPHASVSWKGDFKVILGRSREGVHFGAGEKTVRLVVLLVTGRNQAGRHLKVLSALAAVLKVPEFRDSLIRAADPEAIWQCLRERAERALLSRTNPVALPPLSVQLTQRAVQLAESLNVGTLLLAIDRLSSVPWDTLSNWPGKLLVVTMETDDVEDRHDRNLHIFEVPHAGLSRIDRANLGMLLAASNGLLPDHSDVVCVTGQAGKRLDCIAVIRPADKFHAIFQDNVDQNTARIPPAIILRVISLAIEIASEGREGKAVGTLFVIGDNRQVEKRARQLVLNPFHGFSRRIRNVLDPGLAETIKEFAGLDGAFIVAADGTMLSAGTYVIPEYGSDELPGGLGARHQAAASITARTAAMAIAVSQSTGKVTIFKNGGSVLTLERSAFTRW